MLLPKNKFVFNGQHYEKLAYNTVTKKLHAVIVYEGAETLTDLGEIDTETVLHYIQGNYGIRTV